MEFRNEYAFLSNMYSCEINYDMEKFPCVETAFQYMKCVKDDDREKFINSRGYFVDGYTARKIGRSVELRKDWEEVKVGIMKELLEEKFYHNEKLREALKLTGRTELVEDNNWGDTFWGVCKDKGENMLGKILMEIRAEIQKMDGYPRRVIIAGSRSFKDYSLLKTKMDFYLKNIKSPVIISGGARGADTLGEQYAIERNLPGEQYPADWSIGKHAGFVRNEKMAQVADALIAFWDGKSKGTEHMINTMKKMGKPVRVVKF